LIIIEFIANTGQLPLHDASRRTDPAAPAHQRPAPTGRNDPSQERTYPLLGYPNRHHWKLTRNSRGQECHTSNVSKASSDLFRAKSQFF
jgi:hypothetical protein